MKPLWLLLPSTLLLAVLPAETAGQPYPYPADLPLVRYNMQVQIRPDAHHLDVNGSAEIPPTADPQPYLKVELSNIMRDFSAEFTAPEALRGPAQLKKEEDQGPQSIWLLIPSKPIPPNTTVVIRFHVGGGEEGGFVFYLGPEGTFASGLNTVWYPHVLIHDTNLRVAGTVRYSAPVGYIVGSSGKLLAEESSDANSTFTYTYEHSYFSFTAAKYVVSQHTGKTRTAIYLLRHRERAAELSERLSKIIDLLIDEFGPFPFGELKIIETPHEQSLKAGFSGAGVDGMMFVDSDLLNSEFLLPFYAHELSHFWWGDTVSAGGNLTEAMAQYGSLLAVEKLEGPARARRYRTTGYPGYSITQCARGYFFLAQASLDQPLAKLDSGPVAHEIADGKGFLVLKMLEKQVGSAGYRRALQLVLREEAYRLIDWHHLFDSVTRGRDLSWFFSQWFEQEGAPTLELRWRQEKGKVLITVDQSEPYYRIPLVVEIRGAHRGPVRKRFLVAGGSSRFAVPLSFKVQDVVLDPEYEVLRWTPEYRNQSLALAPYWRAAAKRWTGDYDGAERELRAGLDHVPDPDTFGTRFMLEYGLGRTFAARGNQQEARRYYERAVACPTSVPEILPTAWLELARLAKTAGDAQAVRRAVDQVIRADAAAGGSTGTVGPANALLQ